MWSQLKNQLTLNVTRMTQSHTLNMTPNPFKPLPHEMEQKTFSKSFFFSKVDHIQGNSYPECDPNSKIAYPECGPDGKITYPEYDPKLFWTTSPRNRANRTKSFFKIFFFPVDHIQGRQLPWMWPQLKKIAYPECDPDETTTYPEYDPKSF